MSDRQWLRDLLRAASAGPPTVPGRYDGVRRRVRQRRRRRRTAVGSFVAGLTVALAVAATGAQRQGLEPAPGVSDPVSSRDTAMPQSSRSADITSDHAPSGVRGDMPTPTPSQLPAPPGRTVPTCGRAAPLDMPAAVPPASGLTLELFLPQSGFRPGADSPIPATAVVTNPRPDAVTFRIVGGPRTNGVLLDSSGQPRSAIAHGDRRDVTQTIPAGAVWSYDVRIETSACTGGRPAALSTGRYDAMAVLRWADDTLGASGVWYSPAVRITLDRLAPPLPTQEPTYDHPPCADDNTTSCTPRTGLSSCANAVPPDGNLGEDLPVRLGGGVAGTHKAGEPVTGNVNIDNKSDKVMRLTIDDMGSFGLLGKRGQATGGMFGVFRGVRHLVIQPQATAGLRFSVPTRTCRDKVSLGDPVLPGHHQILIGVHVRGYGWWFWAANVELLP